MLPVQCTCLLEQRPAVQADLSIWKRQRIFSPQQWGLLPVLYSKLPLEAFPAISQDNHTLMKGPHLESPAADVVLHQLQVIDGPCMALRDLLLHVLELFQNSSCTLLATPFW